MPDVTPIPTTVTSKQFSLNIKDFLKGLLVAVIGAALTAIQTSISAGTIVFNWKEIGAVALTAGVAYLLKNFFTPAQVIISPPPVTPDTTVQSKP